MYSKDTISRYYLDIVSLHFTRPIDRTRSSCSWKMIEREWPKRVNDMVSGDAAEGSNRKRDNMKV